MTVIKICCIESTSEADLAIEHGADILGLVGEMPSGPGTIADGLISDIVDHVGPSTQTWLLSSRADAMQLTDHIETTRVTSVQIVRTVDPTVHTELKKNAPGTKRVQVVHVTDRSVLLLCDQYPDADYFLLDSGSTAKNVFGGTGQRHDWSISAEFVERSPVPVFLAGGLHSDNVAEAIRIVKPYGVDVCSGVRTDGKLDPQRLKRFIGAVRG